MPRRDPNQPPAPLDYCRRLQILLLASFSVVLASCGGGSFGSSPPTSLPTVPGNLKAKATSGTQVSLTWTASTSPIGLGGYAVSRCQGVGCSNFAQVSTPVGTTFNDTGLSTGTSYSYEVQAVDTAGNSSAFSSPVSVTTQTPPSVPANLTAVATGTTQISVNWTASTSTIGLANYVVKRCQGVGCSNFAQIAAPVGTTYNDTGLSAGSYTYEVQAVDTAGNSSAFSVPATATTQTPPTVPGNLTAVATSATQIHLSWTASTSAIGLANYVVQRCQGAGCSNFAQIAAPVGTTYNDTGLSAGASYTYEVQAVDTAGNSSAFSSPVSVTTQTPPTIPGNLTAVATSATQIHLSWTASTSAIGLANYVVQRCQGAGCSNFAQIAVPVGTTYNDTGLSAGSYTYEVQAVDTAGNSSAFSSPVSVTTQTPPTIPGNLTATATSATQIHLSWTASTSAIGLANYVVRRCQGVGCSNFAQIAAPVGTTYNDTGLSAGSYTYEVQAVDTAGNSSAFSVPATASTQDPPSVPGNLTATATSATQIHLSWTASTSAIGLANYVVQRCQGAGCSNFAQIAAPVGTTYNDTGLSAGSYTYEVQAVDTAGNSSAFSAPATATTQTPPTVPGNLTAVATSATQIHLSWTASTSTVGLANYVVQRCQGAGCSNFAQIAAPVGTTYNDTGLSAGSYTYEVQAVDTAGNSSAFSVPATATTQTPPTVPGNLTAVATSATQIHLSWTASTSAIGLANYVVQRCQGVGCSNFAQIAAPVGTTYNDTGLSAGSYTYEVQAVDTAGNSSAFSVPATATTQTPPTIPGNLTAVATSATQIHLSWTASTSTIGLANYVVQRCQGAGCSNFAQIAAPVGTTYNDTGLSAGSYTYEVQAVDTAGNSSAFSPPATATTQTPPTVPGNLTATATSATQIHLSWTASTSAIGLANYVVQRCQGAGCSNFAQIAAPVGTTYNDTGLSAGSYTYEVQAVDTAGNSSAFSVPATATTQTPPTVPGNLTATATSATQIHLSWTASTSAIGLANYVVQRCQGVGCSNFAQIAAPVGTTYNDTGLSTGTSYSYEVQAVDTAGNSSAFSSPVSVTTQTPPTVPGNLTAVVTSATQIHLSWTASTSAIGLANYVVQRCQGAGCSNFAQIAAPVGTTYNDTGLSAGASYSYEVQAVDTAGNSSAFPAPATATTQTPPTVPGDLTATATSATQIHLSWTASTSAIGLANYVVQRCQGAGCSNFAQIAAPVGTTYNDTGLSAGSYTYEVQAVDTAGNSSAFSVPATATTQTPPTVPGNLTATATSATQIHLSWTASTSAIGLANYVVQRCQGVGCSNFAQIATPVGTTYNDTGLSAGASYSYEVQAVDTAGNSSAFPAPATATTQTPPTIPNLTATAAVASQISLNWTASTSAIGLANYVVQRCQGAGCSNFTQIATPTGTAYNDTNLLSNNSYSYQVEAVDTAGNSSAFSSVASATTSAIRVYSTNFPRTENPISEGGAWINGLTDGLDWGDVQTTSGLAFGTTISGAPPYNDSSAVLTGPWGADQTAQATVHTVNQTSSVAEEVELRLRTNITAHSITGYEFDYRATADGSQYIAIVRWNGALNDFTFVPGTNLNPWITPCPPTGCGLHNGDTILATAIGNTLSLYVNGVLVDQGTDNTYTGGNPGIGMFQEFGTTNNLADYGFTSLTASDGASVAGTLAPPTVPANLTATAVTASQVNLIWTPSASTVGIAYYVMKRCQGIGCSNFAQITAVTGPTFSDSGLSPGTSYSYEVDGVDAVGNASAFSAPTSATTQTPPTAPTNVTATAVGKGQINLNWTASTSTVGLANYVVQRCQGANCSNFSQIATPASTTYSDAGLSSATSYSYQVQAVDTAGNTGAFSTVENATTSPIYPLKASANNRYLVDQNNVPIFLVGDSPHAMFANLSVADATAYMADRAAHGVNVLWCELLVNNAMGGRSDGSTVDGILPFTAQLSGGQYDLTTPNPAYFDRVDQMINIAASNQITIMLDSMENEGWLSTFEANGNTAAFSWGQYLGNRYKNFSNIVWITGHHFQTWNTSTVDNALAQNIMAGIALADATHLQTTELNENISGSLDDAVLIPNTNLAGAYTYFPVYYEILQQYNSSVETLPVFLAETYYDGVVYPSLNPTTATNLMLRKVAYWTVLSGGLGGYLYGSLYFDFHAGWQTGIDTPAATQLGYWNSLITSVPWYSLVPDQTNAVVTSGFGTATGNDAGNIQTDNFVTTARTPDGSFVLSYCPASTTLTVDMAQLKGPVTARWYDPSTGTFTSISSSPLSNTGVQIFATPGNNGDGDPDWVLVLQSANN